MRPLILISLALAALSAIAAEPAQPYPHWDGQETIAEYAKRAGLEPTKTLDLGNGVKLELVLIPAGKFVMGTEEPKLVDEAGYRSKILTGQVVLGTGGFALLVLLGVVLIQAIRKRQRPQYSLAWFLAMTVAAGIGLLGGLHWHYSERGLADAHREYQTEILRHNVDDWRDKPAHEVTLTNPFYIGKSEVTQEQYQEVIGTNPSHLKGRDLPVELVSWNDAQMFGRRVGERAGWAVRLPTEAEWEHACRAGTRTAYCSGDQEADLAKVGWYGGNSGSTMHPVGQKIPNDWGVYDMHGNVDEWCGDWFGKYSNDAQSNPLNTDSSAEGWGRVKRGGSWKSSWKSCRSACRDQCVPDYRGGYKIGFRVVLPLPCQGLAAPPPKQGL